MLELAHTAGGATRFGFGGDTLNTAVYMVRCLRAAEARVSYVTALGDDPCSDDMAKAWEAEGIDTSLVQRLPGALPGLYLIRNDADGERSFYYWRERAAVRRLFDGQQDLTAALRGVDLVYLSGISMAIFNGQRRERLFELLAHCRDNGSQLAFDTNFRPRLWPSLAKARAAYRAIGPLCDYVLPSIDDENALFGPSTPTTSASRWHGFGAREIVVKSGAGPCWISESAGTAEIEVSPPAILSPIDTTAAGDAFAGAYLSARMQGQEPVTAAAAGHVLAGKVVMHSGAIIASV